MEAAEYITNYINEISGWRGERLTQLRTSITTTEPELVEEWKWGVPVWSALLVRLADMAVAHTITT